MVKNKIIFKLTFVKLTCASPPGPQPRPGGHRHDSVCGPFADVAPAQVRVVGRAGDGKDHGAGPREALPPGVAGRDSGQLWVRQALAPQALRGEWGFATIKRLFEPISPIQLTGIVLCDGKNLFLV